MAEKAKFLKPAMLSACEQIAKQKDIHGRRARALLAVNKGKTIAVAAVDAGLTRGQITYLLSRFRRLGMEVFPREKTVKKRTADKKGLKKDLPAVLGGEKDKKNKDENKHLKKEKEKEKKKKKREKKKADKLSKKAKKKVKDKKKRLKKEKEKEKKEEKKARKKEKKKKIRDRKRQEKKSGKKKRDGKKEKKKKI